MAEKKVQPESPKHEGVDPLTKGETLYPRTNTKVESKKVSKKESKATHDTTTDDKTAETVKDQEEVNAKANTPNDLLPESDKSETPKGETTGSKTSSR